MGPCTIFTLFLAVVLAFPLYRTFLPTKVSTVRGKCAVISGASTGIGVTIAHHLAAEGVHKLVLAARSEAKLQAVAANITQHYPAVAGVLAIKTDVTKDADRVALVAKAVEFLGDCDIILVNNAGVENWSRFEKIEKSKIDLMLDVNLKGLIHLTHDFLPHLTKRGAGHIVNIASIAGKMGGPFMHVYVASKHGVVGFSTALRQEMQFLQTGVTVHVVCPGFISDVGMGVKIIAESKTDFAAVTSVVGASSPMDSAQAVVAAVAYDEPEIIVNSPPMRPLFVLLELMPWFGELLPMPPQVKAFYDGVAKR